VLRANRVATVVERRANARARRAPAVIRFRELLPPNEMRKLRRRFIEPAPSDSA